MSAKAAIHAFPAVRAARSKKFNPQISQINAERIKIRNLRKSAKSADKFLAFLFKRKSKQAALFEKSAQKLLIVFTRDVVTSPGFPL